MLSVLITSFNRQDFIAAAIESVLASSYSDFELIISDDCSQDNTVAIARSYEQEDARVKVYVNEINLGQFANRNTAVSYATGEYIKFLDSDDIIYPYSLQVMMDAMLRFPGAGLGFSVKYKDSEMPYPYLLSSAEALLTHYLSYELLMIGPSGLVIKREAFEKLNGFEEYGMPSDNHLSLKIASRFPVVALQRDLFWWRPHPQQVFSLNKNNHQNILNNYLFNTDILVNHSKLDEKINRKLISNQKKIFYVNLLKLCFKKFKPLTAYNLYKKYLQQKTI